MDGCAVEDCASSLCAIQGKRASIDRPSPHANDCSSRIECFVPGENRFIELEGSNGKDRALRIDRSCS